MGTKLWGALALALVWTGCNGDQKVPDVETDPYPEDTGVYTTEPPPDDGTFDVPCEDTGGPIPVNFVVLTSDTDITDGQTAPTGGVPRTGSVMSSVDYPGPYTGPEVFWDGEIQILTDQFRQRFDTYNARCPDDDPSDLLDDKIMADSGCIEFAYLAHQFRADLDAAGWDATCDDLLDLGDAPAGTTPTAFELLDPAVLACQDQDVVKDGAVNFYVWDNPDDNNSHGTRLNCDENSGSDCHPYVALDEHRLLHTTSSPEEHEMGHAFGLGHVCEPEPTSDADPSNIMQRGESTDLDGAQHCVGGSQGDRSTSFGLVYHDLDGVEYVDANGDPAPLDQVERIAGNADLYRQEWCDTDEADAARYTVTGDPGCQAGTGTFAMVLRKADDRNGDGIGWADMVPVMVSGQPLSQKAWITSAKLVTAGSATRIYAANSGTVLKWSPTDTLQSSGVTTLQTVGQVVPLPAGRVSAATSWAVQGVNRANRFTNPTVQLSWTCANVAGTTTTALTRPTGYLLPLSAFGSTWLDSLVVRPNFAQNRMWVEVRGRPHDAQRLKLTPSGARSAFTLDLMGVHATGEVWAFGNQLKFRLISGTVEGVPLVPFTRTLNRY